MAAPNSPLGPNNNKMHPEDMRNMVIFVLIAAVLYFTYNTFVLEPQRKAFEAQQIAQIKQESTLETTEKVKAEKPLSRAEALNASTATRIKINNDAIFGTISTKGGRIDDISLHKYFETLENEENVAVLSPNRSAFPRYMEFGWVSNEKSIRLPTEDTIWRVEGNTELTPDSPVTLIWNNGQGLLFKRTISVDDEYLLSVSQSVTNNSGKSVTLYPYGLVNQKGIPPYYAAAWVSYEGPIGYVGEELHYDSYSDLRKKGNQSYAATKGWLGITDKYWLAAIVPPQGQDVKYRFNYKGEEKDPDNKGRYQSDFLGAALTLAPGQSGNVESRAFVGAKQVLKLEKYAKDLNIPKFDLAVDFGWFWFLSIPFFYIVHYAGEFVGNFGVAIIILTVTIRGAVFPLTNLSYRSFAKMKKVGPEIKELRENYGDDKQKLQQELVKLYQKEGVNPMAGCLPMLLQIPIFFALYKTLFVTIEMRHAPFFGWIDDLSVPDPTTIFNLFGLIPWDPPQILHIGVWPCVMLLAMIVQKKLNPPPQDALQRDMANYMPFIFCFIMSKFAAGLVIYWSFSAIIGVIQQIIIMRGLGVPIHLFGESEEEKELDDAIENGPDVHPLAEMAEDEVEDALFGHEEEESKKVSKPKPKKSKKKKK